MQEVTANIGSTNNSILYAQREESSPFIPIEGRKIIIPFTAFNVEANQPIVWEIDDDIIPISFFVTPTSNYGTDDKIYYAVVSGGAVHANIALKKGTYFNNGEFTQLGNNGTYVWEFPVITKIRKNSLVYLKSDIALKGIEVNCTPCLIDSVDRAGRPTDSYPV